MAGRAGLRPSDIRIEEQRATTARGVRKPTYNFAGVNIGEYSLTPTMFAPVLAGDTIADASVNLRAILPLQQFTRTQGAWFEHWFFLVRIGDLEGADAIRAMLINPEAAMAVDWRQLCMNAIWSNYFVDQQLVEVDPNAGIYDPGILLRNPRTGWWDSVRQVGSDFLPDEPAEPNEWEGQWQMYQQLRRAKLTTKTYEEYLAAQGVNVPRPLRGELGNATTADPQQQIPELVHYSREFVYPQVSMAPSTGGSIAPAATLQWFIQDKLRRGRFCSEPGFLVGCCAVRSKVYTRTRSAAGDTVGSSYDPLDHLQDADGWMPIDMDTDPHTALVTDPGLWFPAESGGSEEDREYVFDRREPFLFGQDEWQVGTVRNAIAMDAAIPSVWADPPIGSPPEVALGTYNMDAYYSLSIKSRISRDVTL